MEHRPTQTTAYQPRFDSLAGFDDGGGELTQKRLDWLLAANAETLREKSSFSSEREKTEAEMLENPLSVKQTYAYFGLLLGTFPPAAMFIRFFSDTPNFRREDVWMLGVVAVINLIAAIVGYFSGRLAGRVVGELEKLSWTKMLLILPFVGASWGILAGGAGGVIVFIVGAIFGAFLGATVGAAALPAFTVFHRLLKKGDLIDRRQFFPLAFGITFIICAFVLGL